MPAPCKGNTVNTLVMMMLPLQGAVLVYRPSPRALPWARRYCPFGAFVCPLVLTRLPRRPAALHATHVALHEPKAPSPPPPAAFPALRALHEPKAPYPQLCCLTRAIGALHATHVALHEPKAPYTQPPAALHAPSALYPRRMSPLHEPKASSPPPAACLTPSSSP